MKAAEIRQKYLEFFKSKRHSVIPSSSLMPENDPTVLFTTAGMHPLVPYLLGEKHPSGTRLCDSQKCIRTGDIDEVGDGTHLTFFEMLGNWSLGDYFKKEAISWSFEFLTGKDWLNLPLDRLAMSVFAGDSDCPRDEESAGIWKELGVRDGRIAYLPKKDNWWGPAGQTGPCGPDTEMFYWVGGEVEEDGGKLPAPMKFDPDNEKWVEIWNDVFMQYNKKEDGTFEPLSQQNVDTGMGLERVTAVMQGKDNVYDTELFAGVFAVLDEMSSVEASQRGEDWVRHALRVVADHLKAATFIIGDGVVPSNTDQGYVLRRLIRRAVRFGSKLGIDKAFCADIAAIYIDDFGKHKTELETNRQKILDELMGEEKQFSETLIKGEKEFEKLLFRIEKKFEHTGIRDTEISGKESFKLYDTYGFPIEMTEELAKEKGISVDREGFDTAFEEHQALSRAGAEQKFAGGLADHSEETKKLHTATHLMLEALRKVLGEHVNQCGSNITADRLRFDFSHDDKLTDEQKSEVEKFVNDAIKEDYKVGFVEMTVGQARKIGATGIFEDKYDKDLGGRVKVYFMGHGDAATDPASMQAIVDMLDAGVAESEGLPKKEDYFSVEICGGPHAANTGSLGSFKIKKEESSSKGVRRIKAVIGV
ncbi:MAG: alanine--tRNA ligase [Candidatus Peregrinibacteria bacterium]|nr:alanine--tRNA ligase [Candidatus Peregrinibacteria bacterium]